MACIGENMDKHDPEIGCAHQSDRLHIFPVSAFHEFRSYDPGIARHKHDSHGDHDLIGTASHERDKNKSEQNAWKRKDRIIKTHQDLIDPSAVITGQSPDQRPEEHADQICAKRDCKSCPDPDENTAENIPAELIAPHDMFAACLCKTHGCIHCFRIIRGPDDPPENKQEDQDQQDSADIHFSVHLIDFHVVLPAGRSADTKYPP